MDLYQQSCSLVMDLWHQDVLHREAAPQPWVDPHVAPLILEIGSGLLGPLVLREKIPPLVTAFGKHRQELWDREAAVLPKMTCRDNLRFPKTLVKASWNGFVFAQFTAVPDHIYVPGAAPAWANDLALRVGGGFWISEQWQHCFADGFLSLPEFVAHKCCVQFLSFRDSYRVAG